MKIRSFLLVILPFSALTWALPGCRHMADSRSSSSAHSVAEPQLYISYLPEQVKEGSGLMGLRGLIWTFNDSGGKEVLYGMDWHTGEIRQRIKLDDAKNRDWEAIAHDDRYIYVGDFGNNSGARTDLKIYRFPIDSIGNGEKTSVKPDVIRFAYTEQGEGKQFTPDRRFDCEAMVAVDDTLFLFTKDWVNEQTMLVPVPARPGEYRVTARDQFPANGLVTDAGILPDSSLLVLCGYHDYTPFVIVFEDFKGTDFFGGKSRRIDMPALFRVQTEGIYLKNADSVFISSEATDLPPQLYLLKLSSFR